MNEWPETLKLDPGAIQALNKVEGEVALLKDWPEGETLRENPQAEAIARVLIGEFHEHLANADVRHVFRETMSGKWAKAAKADPKLRFYAGADFVITYNWTAWARQLTFVQRVALVDHGLMHCFRGEDAKGETRLKMVDHDLEEFTAIVSRWGLWRPAVQKFVDVATSQLSLPL